MSSSPRGDTSGSSAMPMRGGEAGSEGRIRNTRPGTLRSKAFVASTVIVLSLSFLYMGITPTSIGSLQVRPYYEGLKNLAISDHRSLMSRDVNGTKPQSSTSTVANLHIAPKIAQPRLNVSTFSCLNLVDVKNPTTTKLRETVLKEQLKDGLTYIGKEPFKKYLGMEHVFVVHWTPQATRRQQMHQQLEAIGFKGATYVTGMDASDMTVEQLCGLWMPPSSMQTPEQQIAAEKLVAKREERRREKDFEKIRKRLSRTAEGRAKLADLQEQHRKWKPEPPKAQPFPPYWVSSTAKHFLALHTMVERNYSHALILEDDACITLDPDEYPSAPKCKSSVTPADFRDSLPQRLQQLPENFDMLFVGTCSEDTYMKVVREHRRYKGLVAARYSRCVSGMVVSLSGAKKLLATLPMRHPFDIHINAIATASLRRRGGMDKLRLFWTVPAMMAQTDEGGSSNVIKRKADVSDKKQKD